MIPDTERVAGIIRETAAREIMSRFQRLSKHDVTEKRPGDLVTTADVETEKRLGEALLALMPESAIVGEEAAEKNPQLLKLIDRTAPVWVIDPLDGTHNFVQGVPCFAVIVAYCVGGETMAGWIHDPVADVTAWTAKGEGAWAGGRRLRVASPAAIGRMHGSLSRKLRKRLAARRDPDDIPARTARYGCVGREYMDLGRGKLHFAQYEKRLWPWDHAAGVLLHREAGGVGALTDGRVPYGPSGPGIRETALLLAPDEASWDALHALFATD